MESEDGTSTEAIRHSADNTREKTSEPKRFNQQELNDVMRDFSLSKDKAGRLVPTLKERNLLQSDVRVSHYQIWNNVLKTFLG